MQTTKDSGARPLAFGERWPVLRIGVFHLPTGREIRQLPCGASRGPASVSRGESRCASSAFQESVAEDLELVPLVLAQSHVVSRTPAAAEHDLDLDAGGDELIPASLHRAEGRAADDLLAAAQRYARTYRRHVQ